MASVIKRPNGHKWVQWTDQSGAHKTLRLGKSNQRAAEQHARIIEVLLANATARLPMEQATAEFIGGLDGKIRDRYIRNGLLGEVAKPRKHPTLNEFLDSYFHSKKLEAKPSTWTFYNHTWKRLQEYFGNQRQLKDVTPQDAREFRSWLASSAKKQTESGSLAPNTIRRRIGLCKQIFAQAVRDDLIARNPFDKMEATVRSNKERMHYVDIETFSLVLEKAPNPRWKALLLLARYAAFRVPSEVHGLKWDHVAWEAKRISVIGSPKTEHHASRQLRVVPMHEALESELLKLHAEAPDGAEYVFPDLKETTNLRTGLERIIARAGVAQWPKLWQNLRASACTDFARNNRSHIAAAICGHTVQIAQEHYWQVGTEDIDQARASIESPKPPKEEAAENPKQKAKQHEAESRCTEMHSASGNASLSLENSRNPRENNRNQWARRDSNTIENTGEFGTSKQPEAKAEAYSASIDQPQYVEDDTIGRAIEAVVSACQSLRGGRATVEADTAVSEAIEAGEAFLRALLALE